jgi:hypothetical protein
LTYFGPFGIHGHLVFCGNFGIFSTLLDFCTKENVATLNVGHILLT